MIKPSSPLLLWDEYWGRLHNDADPRFTTQIYGFENHSEKNRQQKSSQIPRIGGCFGFVASGLARISDETIQWDLIAEQWFSLTTGPKIELLEPETRIMICQRVGYRGVRAMGGPVEEKGRLRYIDGCSDTLLASPPVLGEPVLNLLHFPKNVDQTQHSHPSTRAGIVARGSGVCVTPEGRRSLYPGLIFYIPSEGLHKFQTGPEVEMDVIAYHPDSDWGPTHEVHPMINRTLVNGIKVDNTEGVHAGAEIISEG